MRAIAVVCCIIALYWPINELMAATRRDPTKPPESLHSMSSVLQYDFVVNSILLSPQRRIAIVDGIVVKEGDKIKNVMVVEINKNAVMFKQGNKTFKRKLINEKIKIAQPTG